MKFPLNAYRTPGLHKGNHGVSFDYIRCDNEEDLKKAISGGYSASFADAVAGKKPDPVVEVPSEDAPPTRAEIEEQARKVGVKVDGRMSSATLLKLIDEAMDPKEA